MNSGGPYEKGALRNRFRELVTLAGFTLTAAVLSVLSMDIIALPLTLIAVNKTAAFNKAIILLFAGMILLLTLYPLTRRVMNLTKNGMSPMNVFIHLAKKTGYSILLVLMFLSISAVMISILYLLLYNNHFLLHRALNIP